MESIKQLLVNFGMDMKMRGMSEHTQRGYTQHIERFLTNYVNCFDVN